MRFAYQTLQYRLDVDASRKRRRAHRRLGFANGESIIDREAHADVVNGVARLELASEMIALREWLCIHEPGFDLPQPIVAEVASAFDRTPMHQATPFATILVHMRHLLLPLLAKPVMALRNVSVPFGAGRRCC
jgi:hypothetical protein